MYDNKGFYIKDAPDCDHNPRELEYCFDPNKANDGTKLSMTILGVYPPFYSEVFLRMSLCNNFEL